MKKPAIAASALALVASAALVVAQDAADKPQMPDMPKPVKQHKWLEKFVGHWDTEGEMTMPDQPPVKSTGEETVRSVGGFWIVSNLKSDFMGHPMEGVMTLGYDPEAEKFIGTWIDSMGSYLWKYEGVVDESGNKLTLSTEGPCPLKPGEIVKFKEVLEFKGDDERVFTSSFQNEDGSWQTPMKATARRKK